MKGIVLFSYSLLDEQQNLRLFYEHLFHGRMPVGYVEKKQKSYADFGFTDPLTHYIRSIAGSLEQATDARVYIGCKHTQPFVEDAMAQVIKDGITELYMLALTPLISKTGTISYEQKVQKIVDEKAPHIKVVSLNGYSTEQAFVHLMACRVTEAIRYAGHPQPTIIFTSHSLPGTEHSNRDFIAQYKALATAIMNEVGDYTYRLAYRSVGPATQKWLRPDILTVLEEEQALQTEAVVVCELLSIVENMEVLEEIGQQARNFALTRGMSFIQTRYVNDSYTFVQFLQQKIK